jgi:hypothetical protein
VNVFIGLGYRATPSSGANVLIRADNVTVDLAP